MLSSFLVGDQAVIQLSAINAGQHAQLVGPYSHYGWHHPGPSWFYLLDTVFLPLGSRGYSLLAAILVLQAVVAMAVVAIVWRRFGTPAALVSAALLLLFLHDFSAMRLMLPWNPDAVVLPTVLLLLLAGATAEGSMVAFAGALVVGSFLVQTHVGTTTMVVGVLIVAVVLAALHVRTTRGGQPVWLAWAQPGATRTWRGRLTLAGSVALALLVGLMWVPPAIEQLNDRPGNLRALFHFVRTAHAGHTLRDGVDLVGAQLSAFPFGREQESMAGFGGGTGAHLLVLLGWAVVALALAVVATRMRRGWVQAVAIGSLIAIGIAVWSVSRIPLDLDSWLVQRVAVLPLVLCTGVVALASEGRWVTDVVRRAVTAVATVVVALLMAGGVSDFLAVPPPTLTTPDAAATENAVSAALHRLPPGNVLVGVDTKTEDAWPVAAGITVRLLLDGRHVVIDDRWLFLYGGQFARNGSHPALEVDVVAPATASSITATPGSRLVAQGSGVQVFVVNHGGA